METTFIKFERPEMLYLLLAAPVMLAIFLIANYLRKRNMRRFASVQMHDLLIPQRSQARRWVKFLLLTASWIFAVIALANPQSGAKLGEVKREGIDLFIALDVSNSMLAEDIMPNRLDRSRHSIIRLIDRLKGDRIGLIVFAGKAYVQLPLTTDYAAARLFLNTVRPDMIPVQGTAIAEAIRMAMQSFDVETRNKGIIIISDGEDHEQGALDAAKEASAAGIRIFTIGMGSPDGVPIPVYNQFGKQTGYRKDRQGNTIVTRLNETILQQIAAAGNGTYIRASNARTGLDQIMNELEKIEKSEIESKVFTEYNSHFQWFTGVAIALLIMEMLLAWRKSILETRIRIFKPKTAENE
jgi:Ca-activated chloride channel family protein